MNLGNVLSNGSFWRVNKKLVHIIGWEGAIILADLITKREYFRVRGELREDDSFFNTQRNIERDTLLSPYQQRLGMERLKEEGFLKIKKEGNPARNYFYINDEEIGKTLCQIK